jgi:hypothetical protein
MLLPESVVQADKRLKELRGNNMHFCFVFTCKIMNAFESVKFELLFMQMNLADIFNMLDARVSVCERKLHPAAFTVFTKEVSVQYVDVIVP